MLNDKSIDNNSVYVDMEAFISGNHADFVIPDGEVELPAGYFDEYNSSSNIQNISKMLIAPQYYINQWKKKLSRTQMVKKIYPKGVKTISDKAAYMYEKDINKRIYSIFLPASIEKVYENSFPVFLKKINVDENNKEYVSVDGILFTRNLKNLVRFPGCMDQELYTVPKGTLKICAGAFCNAIINELILPETLEEIEPGSFVNSKIKKIKISEGLTAIHGNTFNGSSIEEMYLPESLKIIENYAFRDISNIKKIECESEHIEIGHSVFSEGIFESINWWIWSEIPKATFLNSRINNICIPEGVEKINDYAFAGCYSSKSITIPGTVKEIGEHSFDEGINYDKPITIPKDLYKFICRMPIKSKINGLPQIEICRNVLDALKNEKMEILLNRKEELEVMLKKKSFILKKSKQDISEHLMIIKNIIDEKSEGDENE